jgi:hypothetical protein
MNSPEEQVPVPDPEVEEEEVEGEKYDGGPIPQTEAVPEEE